MDKYPKWKRLIGLPVEIRQAGHTVAAGTVDDAMPDSSILWLAFNGTRLRTMYERSLKYEAWVDLDILPKKRTSPNNEESSGVSEQARNTSEAAIGG
ncbi:hypothetical protein F8G81_20175 [Arthrobacter sp. CDRTa11]|uniref:hypothetical protein n=1 Tax=Arthrobacter sp. CDRTa11 TaxID=2651199 RepID=UPI002265A1E8|nr:hypothetical protein [Arthrobacter sp. CDRTa11]UZX04656.1 hypothetical protein F8G81_20175 [Arthrobacter sp. CDRTa11]